jgi:hypothetical protein
MDDSLRQRLRSLGEHDVRGAVATTHLARMATVRPRRILTSAVAVAVTVVGSAAVVGVALAAQSPDSVSTRPSPDAAAAPHFEVPRRDAVTASTEQTDEEPFSCTGPPPFAGEVPESEEARAAEAEAFSEFRATQCPQDDDEAPPASTDPCVGPPPFAGVKPADGRTRAAEATEFARVRAACHATTTSTTTTTTAVAPSATPDSVPVGPPPDRPAGPPDSVPVGPPPDVSAGPPDDVPAGPPPDRPGGNEGGD